MIMNAKKANAADRKKVLIKFIRPPDNKRGEAMANGRHASPLAL